MERSSFATVEAAVLRRVAQNLRPEYGPRINEKLVFARLTPEVQREIAELVVTQELTRLRSLGHDLVVSSAVLEFLAREGYDPQLSAADTADGRTPSAGSLRPEPLCPRLCPRISLNRRARTDHCRTLRFAVHSASPQQ